MLCSVLPAAVAAPMPYLYAHLSASSFSSTFFNSPAVKYSLTTHLKCLPLSCVDCPTNQRCTQPLLLVYRESEKIVILLRLLRLRLQLLNPFLSLTRTSTGTKHTLVTATPRPYVISCCAYIKQFEPSRVA